MDWLIGLLGIDWLNEYVTLDDWLIWVFDSFFSWTERMPCSQSKNGCLITRKKVLSLRNINWNHCRCCINVLMFIRKLLSMLPMPMGIFFSQIKQAGLQTLQVLELRTWALLPCAPFYFILFYAEILVLTCSTKAIEFPSKPSLLAQISLAISNYGQSNSILKILRLIVRN